MEDLFSLIDKKKSEIKDNFQKDTGENLEKKPVESVPLTSESKVEAKTESPAKAKESATAKSNIAQNSGVKTDYDAEHIEVLEGLEAVRKRPGMYIGGTDENALHHMIGEIVDNSMDEVVAGHAKSISVYLREDNTIEISDNGRGIPVDNHPKFPDKSALEVILTTLHSGGKFSNKAYATSGGLHGVGISVVNALSDDLVVEVTRNGKVYRQQYSRGFPQTALEVVSEKARGSGTSVMFHPDEDIFGNRKFKAERIYNLLKAKAYLQSGVIVNWTCDESLIKEGSDIPTEDKIHFDNGIRDFLSDYLGAAETIGKDYFYGATDLPNGDGKIEWTVAFTEDLDGRIFSYCNTIPTPNGGTHETGFRISISKALREYGERAGVKKVDKITADDVFSGAVVVLSLFYKEPEFQGQTKEKLVNQGLSKLVDNAVKDKFDNLLASDPKLANQLLEFVVFKMEERLNRRSLKQVQRKTVTSKLRLPGKLADCSSNETEECEVFIVEGDSAGGSAKQARDRKTQAILPIRGKILNVASATRDKIHANQEIKDMTIAFGCGTGKDFREADLRYGKIIIMTDADVDGAHIASLLITFFFQEMRGLIEAGRLYLAQPPLFRLKKGEKILYASSDEKKDKLREKLESEGRGGKVEVSRFKGLGEMTPAQLKTTTMERSKRHLIRIMLDDEEGFSAKIIDDLMGKKPEKRLQFIQNNSDEIEKIAAQLDV